MVDHKTVERRIISEDSSLLRTKHIGFTIQSLLNPTLQPADYMFRSRHVDFQDRVSSGLEEFYGTSSWHASYNHGCLLHFPGTERNKNCLYGEVSACHDHKRTLSARTLSSASDCLQDQKILQAVVDRTSYQNEYDAHGIGHSGGNSDIHKTQEDLKSYFVMHKTDKGGFETQIVARTRFQLDGSDVRASMMNGQAHTRIPGETYNVLGARPSRSVRNGIRDMPASAETSIVQVDNPTFKTTDDSQDHLSPRSPRLPNSEGRIRNQLLRHPKLNRTRRYLKKIGIPKYRYVSPLAPLGRRSNHTKHLTALNMVHSEPPNMCNSAVNEYPTRPALSEPVWLSNPFSGPSHHIYEDASSPAVAQELASTFHSPHIRYRPGPEPPRSLQLMNDASGLTCSSFPTSLNNSPDFVVTHYSTASSMVSENVHICQ